MLTLYQSNQLDILKSLLASQLSSANDGDPFAQENVLVQSPGMSQWLKLELATELGVCANIQFPLAATFIWKLFTSLLPEVPARSAFSKEAMSWHLMSVLDDFSDDPRFATISHYQHDGDPLKRYQLCVMIADLFDQYQVYRPEWILGWEQGDDSVAESQPWQPVLWRALLERIRSLDLSLYHRASLYERFVKLLKVYPPKALPERLFVFGISALPPQYLQLLSQLSSHVEIHLFQLNPCNRYWGDLMDAQQLLALGLDEASMGHPLLASMGKLGRDHLRQLAETDCRQIDAFSEPYPLNGAVGLNLLQQVQSDILNLHNRAPLHLSAELVKSSQHKTELAEDDRSIQLHLCHSPLREAEVLHDQLLDLFEQDPELSPRDVVVMMPDVNSYAPFIQAVFSAAPRERYIPFAIADLAASQEAPLIGNFLRLLKLGQSRFSCSEVLELLEIPAVMGRFALKQDQFDRLKRWVEDSGVRWGLDARDGERFGIGSELSNSWEFGLQRMMLGMACGGDNLYQEILPYDGIEGLESATLGKLAQFISTLKNLLQEFQTPRSVEEWQGFILALLEEFYLGDDESEGALQLIRDELQKLGEILAESRYRQGLPIEILSYHFEQRLNESHSGHRFLAGRVNFCTLMPMRSIPFKVVCLLGMNDGAYPRSIAPSSFDLMIEHPCLGDRSRRDDDRYLFLEALMSAQQQLYISLVGFSHKDNSERVPSVLVSELLEYIGQGFCLADDRDLDLQTSSERLQKHLSVAHSLTPWNSDYYRLDTRRAHSWVAEWLSVVRGQGEPGVFIDGALPEVDPSERLAELELADLLRFYRDPIRYWFNRRLNIYFSQQLAAQENDEPFELDALAQYQLREQLLEASLQDQAGLMMQQKQLHSGHLPGGVFGPLQAQSLLQSVQPLVQQVSPWLQSCTGRCEVRIELSAQRLTGWLRGAGDNTLLRYRSGGLHGKYLLGYWIEHLCMTLSTQSEITTRIFGRSKEDVRSLWFKPVEIPKARELLEQLIDGYWQGQCAPMWLRPSSGVEFLQSEPEKAQANLMAAFKGDFNRIGECEDPYLRRLLVDCEEEAILMSQQQLARDYLSEMLNHLEEAGE